VRWLPFNPSERSQQFGLNQQLYEAALSTRCGHRKLRCSFYRRMIPMGDRRPMVSFGFADFPRSAYLVAGRILESFGGRGTCYVAPNLWTPALAWESFAMRKISGHRSKQVTN
jgi:hypothetical protein